MITAECLESPGSDCVCLPVSEDGKTWTEIGASLALELLHYQTKDSDVQKMRELNEDEGC